MEAYAIQIYQLNKGKSLFLQLINECPHFIRLLFKIEARYNSFLLFGDELK